MIVDRFDCEEIKGGVRLRGFDRKEVWIYEFCEVCLLIGNQPGCPNDRISFPENGYFAHLVDIPRAVITTTVETFLGLRSGEFMRCPSVYYRPRVKLFRGHWGIDFSPHGWGVLISPSGYLKFWVPFWGEKIHWFLTRLSFTEEAGTCLLWDPRTWWFLIG